MKKKRVVVLSDLHSGHRAGLTHPDWQFPNAEYRPQQKKMWEFYSKEIEKLKPIDIVVINGDAIDGKGEKTGGTEMITGDRQEQVNIAYKCIEITKAKEYYMTYGTPYHTGVQEDWEKQLADKLNAKIKGHLMLKINNTIFDFKHKIGSSTIPHGRYTPIAREKLWNMVWSHYDGQKDADIVIRSHVHYFLFEGDNKYLNIVTPALQGFGSKYGVRQCAGIVTVGFIYFDVYDDTFEWGNKTMEYEVATFKNVLTPRLK